MSTFLSKLSLRRGGRCPPAAELDQLVHGELSPRASLRIDLHLSACRACAAEVATLTAERRALAARARQRTVPAHLMSRVEARLREASAQATRPTGRWSFAPLVMTAMAAMLFFALLPAPVSEPAAEALTASAEVSGINQSRDVEHFSRLPASWMAAPLDPEISRTEAEFSACLKATPCAGGKCLDVCR